MNTLKYQLIFVIAGFILMSNPVAAQLFIVGDTLNPTITYSNIQDTSLPFIVKGHFEFDIDIDFDEQPDVRFYREHSSSPSFGSETYSVQSLNTIRFVCIPHTSDADTLAPGTVLDKNQNWNNDDDGAVLYYYFNSYIPPPWGPPSTSHGICTKENLYIGFRKINDVDTLYGWFNIDLLQPYTIKSFAVNKNFNTGYLSNQLSFKVYPNPAKDRLVIENNNVSENEFLIVVMNALGQELINQKTKNTDHCILDLSGLRNGVYFLRIIQHNKAVVKKIVINK